MNQTLKEIKKFHGHIGPYVVIGYKMGKIANQHLGSDPFCKKVQVWTKNYPPMSCVIDGIQLSSGCTLGKGSIIIKNGNCPKTEFTNKKGEKIQIYLKNNIKSNIEQNVTNENMESFSEEIYQIPDSELFEIKYL